MALTTIIDIDAYLRRFWELESIRRKTEVQPEDEEKEEEKHFLATHYRDEQDIRHPKHNSQIHFKEQRCKGSNQLVDVWHRINHYVTIT